MAGFARFEPLRGMALDKEGIDPIRHDVGMLEETLEETEIGRDALDPHFTECAVSQPEGLGIIVRPGVRDHLGEQAVEVGTRLETRMGVVVHPDTRARRRLENRKRATGRSR